MAAQAPYAPPDPGAVSRMIERLETAKKDKRHGGFSCKKTSFKVKHSRDGIDVDSWRLQDWDYKKEGLPTYARGLFTTQAARGHPEIAVRGYDKFFNVDEVHDTKWENIIKKTQGPYELTLKENGCIIFIAGLEDETLLVCSKHSTGDRSDADLSHARAGEVRIEQQLTAIGKTKSDLARELRARNATAVAELCDDSFEEHILAYEGDKAGLYLHGINLNVPEFATYPSSLVQEFARQWGFIQTGLAVMQDIREVRAFLEGVATTGAHDGRDVEGFVIRCRLSQHPGTLPYRDWFFKYKFEEPYLMYRQWRECTKALISGKSPRYKKHAKITEEYLLYARRRLAADPKLGKLYNQNHGIIKLRDDFLAFKNIKGADAANLWELERVVMGEVTKDVILSPISTIGCGKTTLAIALSHLFSWGHVQNDNITGKGRPPRFVKAVMDELEDHAAVFADRNNAAKHERKQLITDVKAQRANVKVVCLAFRHGEESIEEIRRVTRERVLERGDNHQTIQAATDKDKFMGVMESFIRRFEECSIVTAPDNGFDLVIELDPVVGSRQNLETIVTELHKSMPNLVKEMPSSEKLDEAIEVALDYRPDLRHTIRDRGARKDNNRWQQDRQVPRESSRRSLEYMAIHVPTTEINACLNKAFAGLDAETCRFLNQLRQTRRIQSRFHVTLMHRAGQRENPELWQHYVKIHEEAGGGEEPLGSCDVLLERVVFDDRIMAIVVRLSDKEGRWECANRVAHITVGTRDDSVKPKESNDMLARWLEVGVGGEGNMLKQAVFSEMPALRGEVRGVLSR